MVINSAFHFAQCLLQHVKHCWLDENKIKIDMYKGSLLTVFTIWSHSKPFYHGDHFSCHL